MKTGIGGLKSKQVVSWKRVLFFLFIFFSVQLFNCHIPDSLEFSSMTNPVNSSRYISPGLLKV